jgi:hypothetical protein
MEFGPRIK